MGRQSKGVGRKTKKEVVVKEEEKGEEEDESVDSLKEEDEDSLVASTSIAPPSAQLNDGSEAGKKRSPGVIYLSSIPYNMSVSRMREMIQGSLAEPPCAPKRSGGQESGNAQEKHFVEGWVEYKRKKVAKRVAQTLNNTQVGGNRRAKYYDCLWNMKYLHRFKWVHLDEQLRYEKEVIKTRRRTEISAAKRKAAFFANQVQKGANLRKLEETVLKKGGLWEKYQKQIKQRSTLTKKKKAETENRDSILDMILGE